jgi:hypothetical protein
MKLYTVTYEEIKAMTFADVNALINAIENDGGFISAMMADRLIGTEKKEYEHNEATLSMLRQRQAQLKPIYTATLHDNLAYNERRLAELRKTRERKEIAKKIWAHDETQLDWIKCECKELDQQIATLEQENKEILTTLNR